MKTKIFFAILLILAGSVSSCGTKEEDIDMSAIDFSNIENLWAQPLPVIQKCVQGKWKWYVSSGGLWGVDYHEDVFIDIHDDRYTITYRDGSQRSTYFTWKRCTTVGTGHKTYGMWDKERDVASWYFLSIRNDTLSAAIEPPPGSADIPSGFGFVRMK
jgi:hypothetical protein